MRLTASEKAEIVQMGKRSPAGVTRALKSLSIHKRTFYNWYHAYSESGINGLQPKQRSKQQWNRVPQEQRDLVIALASYHPELSCRELASWYEWKMLQQLRTIYSIILRKQEYIHKTINNEKKCN